MAEVHWTDEDRTDPYPATLETLRKVFEFANDDSAHTGVLGGSEPKIIGEMWAAAEEVLAREDPDSVTLFRGPALQEQQQTQGGGDPGPPSGGTAGSSGG